MAGPDQGRELVLGARPTVVGAGGRSDMVLTDGRVSREHLELQLTPQGVRLRDLGSTNGTHWSGAQVSDVLLPPGAIVEIGDSKLAFSALDTPRFPPSERRRFGALVGGSVVMREVFAALELASKTNVTILLQGESGTGKEIAARAIHDHSTRAARPFVVVDCGTLNEELIESQLFGHKKGAFTGAATERAGAFSSADGGTLFLDELGELPPNLQPKLLRAIEQGEILPLGSDRPIAVDVRLVAATHRDLQQMVHAGTFRFDLFHRIAVVHVGLPPLRDHLEDLPDLVRAFYEGRGVHAGEVEGDNLDRLKRHSWPGNVRELRNALERAWALSEEASFAKMQLWFSPDGQAHHGEDVDSERPFKDAKEACVAAFERRYLEAVYAKHGGNISRAARHAGISRRHFRELIDKHGLRP